MSWMYLDWWRRGLGLSFVLLNFVLLCPCRRSFFFIKYRIQFMSFPGPSFLSYPAPLVNSNKHSGNKIMVYHFLEMRSSSISDVTCALRQGWRNQISRYYSLDKQRIEDSRLTYAAVDYLRIWKYRYPRQSPVRGLKRSMKIKRKKDMERAKTKLGSNISIRLKKDNISGLLTSVWVF